MSIGHGTLPAAALRAERAGERATGSARPDALRRPAAALRMAALLATAVHMTATLKRPRGHFRVANGRGGGEAPGSAVQYLEEIGLV
ncbi:hypothetical protein R1flu_028354 [Riccia fluitans]|uniref:Uncharacterized protein n=1 Tax=Riccia fluitans TaxID=41844 RepID=A0ABD1XPA3_9MARC